VSQKGAFFFEYGGQYGFPSGREASSPQRGCAQRKDSHLSPVIAFIDPRWSRPLMRWLVLFFCL